MFKRTGKTAIEALRLNLGNADCQATRFCAALSQVRSRWAYRCAGAVSTAE